MRAVQVMEKEEHAMGRHRLQAQLTWRACLTSQALLERLRKTPVNGVKFKG